MRRMLREKRILREEMCKDASLTPKAAIDEELLVNTAINPDVLIARVTVPTLITRAALGTLAADRGFLLAPDEAERVRGIIPGCQLALIPDTNHYTIVLSPVFTERVLDFLAGRIPVAG